VIGAASPFAILFRSLRAGFELVENPSVEKPVFGRPFSTCRLDFARRLLEANGVWVGREAMNPRSPRSFTV
jgi:hypothetical protein